MSRQFLVYWRAEQVAASLADVRLDHAASEQFGRVRPGDVLWICGQGKEGGLVTVGPLPVAEVVGQKAAERRLRYPPWRATFHAMAIPGRETVAREVLLAPILARLRFMSKQSPKLKANSPWGQQLQAMRELTPESSRLIRQLWGHGEEAAASHYEAILSGLARFDSLDAERSIQARREQAFLRRFHFRSSAGGTCSICGASLPVAFLVAAHIKPRAKCTERERRDYTNNVVPICVLGCDALFERGFISVPNGVIVVRAVKDASGRLRSYLRDIRGRKVSTWRPSRVKYFRWHAAHAKRVREGEDAAVS